MQDRFSLFPALPCSASRLQKSEVRNQRGAQILREKSEVWNQRGARILREDQRYGMNGAPSPFASLPLRVERIQSLVLPASARFPLAEQATSIAGGATAPTSPELRAAADAALPSLQASREQINAAEFGETLASNTTLPLICIAYSAARPGLGFRRVSEAILCWSAQD